MMGRRKGDTYRKWKTKEIVRVRCPGWTIRLDVLSHAKHAAAELEICESRLVELAIKQFLNGDCKKPTKPAKIFTKN